VFHPELPDKQEASKHVESLLMLCLDVGSNPTNSTLKQKNHLEANASWWFFYFTEILWLSKICWLNKIWNICKGG